MLTLRSDPSSLCALSIFLANHSLFFRCLLVSRNVVVCLVGDFLWLLTVTSAKFKVFFGAAKYDLPCERKINTGSTEVPAYSDSLGTWEKCHCNQIVTVTRGSLVTNQSFWTCQKCKRGVTVNSVTVSGEICTHMKKKL